MMQLCLLDLPSELLLEILRKLDYRALLRCCVVCQTFKKIVDGYVELQYLIELGADGLVDGPENTLTHVDRLALLFDRRKAWAHLEWKRRSVVSMRGTCQAYELVGGVFAKTMSDGSGGSRHLIASWLPSAHDEGHQLRRKDIGLLTRDFAIDPSQDLIAFMQADDNSFVSARRKVYIHLRTLSTNHSHPNARSPIIHCDISFAITTAFVQIVDDIIGMIAWAEGPQLLIWNWTDGTLILHHVSADLPAITKDFSFISNRAYMLASGAHQGSLEVYNFESRPTSVGSTGSIHVASLLLPDAQDSVGISHLSTHTGPFYARCDPGKVFTTSLDPRVSRIHVISIQYTTGRYDFQPKYCFFLHNRTLLSYIPSKATSGSAVTVPWDHWGPEHTRFFAHHISFPWLRYVQGQRVVTPPHLHNGTPTIQVFDFNVHSSRTHTNFSHPYRDYDGAQDGLISNKFVNYITHVPARDVFRQPVMTRLPYHVVSRVDSERYSGFMIDEERIIGIKTDASGLVDEDMDDIHVFVL